MAVTVGRVANVCHQLLHPGPGAWIAGCGQAAIEGQFPLARLHAETVAGVALHGDAGDFRNRAVAQPLQIASAVGAAAGQHRWCAGQIQRQQPGFLVWLQRQLVAQWLASGNDVVKQLVVGGAKAGGSAPGGAIEISQYRAAPIELAGWRCLVAGGIEPYAKRDAFVLCQRCHVADRHLIGEPCFPGIRIGHAP
ncbi:hypothetical protein D3C71_1604870 [compost metagenome]